MKITLLGIIAIIVASCVQLYCIGLNGLTLISLPMTIHLGIHIIEKLQEQEQK